MSPRSTVAIVCGIAVLTISVVLLGFLFILGDDFTQIIQEHRQKARLEKLPIHGETGWLNEPASGTNDRDLSTDMPPAVRIWPEEPPRMESLEPRREVLSPHPGS